MNASSNLKLTIEFNAPELKPEQRDQQAQFLMNELRDMDEIDSIESSILIP